MWGADDISGYEFIEDLKVKRIIIKKKKGNCFPSGKFIGKPECHPYISRYSTNNRSITVGTTIIDRLTLKAKETINSINLECKLIEDNFESYMNDRSEKLKNEIKSKQKI